jgi:tetratricopeptide (TPR) repeat protein
VRRFRQRATRHARVRSTSTPSYPRKSWSYFKLGLRLSTCCSEKSQINSIGGSSLIDSIHWPQSSKLLTSIPTMAEQISVLMSVLESSEDMFGPEHETTLTTVLDLAELYHDQNNLVEAEAMFRRVLEVSEKFKGPENVFTLHAIRGLGDVYKKQKPRVGAEVMYQRALDGYEKFLGPEHRETLDTLSRLGRLYEDQNRLVESEVML